MPGTKKQKAGNGGKEVKKMELKEKAMEAGRAGFPVLVFGALVGFGAIGSGLIFAALATLI